MRWSLVSSPEPRHYSQFSCPKELIPGSKIHHFGQLTHSLLALIPVPVGSNSAEPCLKSLFLYSEKSPYDLCQCELSVSVLMTQLSHYFLIRFDDCIARLPTPNWPSDGQLAGDVCERKECDRDNFARYLSSSCHWAMHHWSVRRVSQRATFKNSLHTRNANNSLP